MTDRKASPGFMGIDEAAKMLRVSPRHVRRMAMSGRFVGAHQKNGVWMIPMSVLSRARVGFIQEIRGVRDELREIMVFCNDVIERIDKIIDQEVDCGMSRNKRKYG